MGRQPHVHALTASAIGRIGVTALGHDRCVVQRMEVGVGDSLDGCAAAVRRAGTVMRTHNLPHRPWPLWLRCGETRPELRRAASSRELPERYEGYTEQTEWGRRRAVGSI
jgi:hypothetical protein